MMWVNDTLPPRERARRLLMTMRLSTSSLAGTERTLVAVGTSRLVSMLEAVRAGAPRSGTTSASSEAVSAAAGLGGACWAGVGLPCAGVGLGGAAFAGAGWAGCPFDWAGCDDAGLACVDVASVGVTLVLAVVAGVASFVRSRRVGVGAGDPAATVWSRSAKNSAHSGSTLEGSLSQLS